MGIARRPSRPRSHAPTSSFRHRVVTLPDQSYALARGRQRVLIARYLAGQVTAVNIETADGTPSSAERDATVDGSAAAAADIPRTVPCAALPAKLRFGSRYWYSSGLPEAGSHNPRDMCPGVVVSGSHRGRHLRCS